MASIQIHISTGIYEVSSKNPATFERTMYCMKGSFVSDLTPFKDNAYIFIEYNKGKNRTKATYSLNNSFVTESYEYTTNKPIPLIEFRKMINSTKPNFEITNR